jgi:diguanylate cyclase (GGDEF)-like protein
MIRFPNQVSSPGDVREPREPLDPRLWRLRLQAAALAVLFLALLLVQAVAANRRAGRIVGLTAGDRDPGVLAVVDVVPDGPAALAGVQSGDRIVGIEGQALRSWTEFDTVAADFRAGEPERFTVERAGRKVDLVVRPGVPMAWWPFFLNALNALAYFALALLAMRQQDHDLRARLLFLFALAVTLEFLLPGPFINPLYEMLVAPGFFLVTGLQMGLEIHLASVIPEQPAWQRRRPWLVGLLYAVGLTLGMLGFVTVLAGYGRFPELPWTLGEFGDVFFQYGFLVWALAVVGLLARSAMRHPEPQGRQQAALVLAGVLPWTAGVAIGAGHFFAGLAAPPWLAVMEPFALLCYPVAVLIAISRFQLFDMELVVRRSLVYTALSTAMLLIFYAALGAGGVLFSEFVTGGDRIWVVAVATLLLGLVFTPLRRGLETVVYRRFFPERVELRQRLTALASELPALGKLPLMGERLVESLGGILGVRWATLLIADPRSGLLMPLATTVGDLRSGLEHSLLLSPADPGLKLLTQSGRAFPARQLAAKSAALAQRLDDLRAEVAVPLLAQGRLIGLLLLGPKHSGDRYLSEEMDLLNLLAQHVAIVFENARLFESATRDSLTGLLRREAVLEKLDSELQRAQRYGRPLAVGLADLDHFKSVNDRFGHLTGDSVLKWVSHVIQGGLRATDHVGRYGGEEFLLVLPETDLPGAVAVAEKVRCLVERGRFTTEDGDEVTVTLSIGLCSLADLHPDRVNARELLAIADRWLYRAKDDGRNQVHPAVIVGAQSS